MIDIEWGGKRYEYATPEDARKMGFHLESTVPQQEKPAPAERAS